MIITLPGDKHILVDAKAPLLHYLESTSAKTSEEYNARLKDHARTLTSHIKGLSDKKYWAHTMEKGGIRPSIPSRRSVSKHGSRNRSDAYRICHRTSDYLGNSYHPDCPFEKPLLMGGDRKKSLNTPISLCPLVKTAW